MADWLKQAALRTAGRRWGFALGALVVLALHLWLAVALDEMRLDWEAVAEMPKRLQVAYVRELAQAEPPAPPAKLVPPMMTAAMAESSRPLPAVGWAVPRRAVRMKPATAAKTPEIMNAMIFTRVVLMPARRAASSLSPVAYSSRP